MNPEVGAQIKKDFESYVNELIESACSGKSHEESAKIEAKIRQMSDGFETKYKPWE